MKKTLLLTLVLMLVGGVNVYATRVYADLSKLSSNQSTWDGSTNTMTWTALSNNMISNLDFAAGDYKTYSKVVVDVSDLTNAVGIRLQIKANGIEKTVVLKGNGTFEKSLIDDFGFTVVDLEKFQWARFLGSGQNSNETHTINADNPASAKINSVYLEQPTTTKEVDLTAMAASNDNATWNKDTGIFAWTLNYSNSIPLPGLTGNLSAYTTLNYETVAGTSENFRILIYYTNGAAQTTYSASVGTKSISFASMGVSKENLAFISSINIAGAATASGDIKVTSISLEGPENNFIEATTTYSAPAGTTDLNGMTGAGDIKWNVAYPKEIVNETGWCGNIDSDNQSINITNYDYLHFVVSSTSSDAHTGLRVFVWDGSNRITLYPHPIADYANVSDWTSTSWITEPGTYVVKISDYSLLRGFKALQGWAGNAGTSTIAQAYLSKGNPVAYLPSGKYTLVGELTGSSSLTAALADETANYYDATGVMGENIDLAPTGNPYALFKANSGVLTNTKNVIVNGTIANLELADNHPFVLPASAMATAATYSRTMPNAFGTLCLPYPISRSGDVKYYTANGIEDGALQLTPITNVPAGTPVIVYKDNYTANEAITVTGSGALATAPKTEAQLIGTYEQQVINVTQDTSNDYYYIASGAFWHATGTLTVNPFRAYLKTAASGTGGTKLRLQFKGDEEVTAIQTLTGENNAVEAIYNANGVLQNGLQKGLNIVKMQNGKNVKVYVK